MVCVACWEKPRCVALLPCKHFTMCSECHTNRGKMPGAGTTTCPICDTEATGSVTLSRAPYLISALPDVVNKRCGTKSRPACCGSYLEYIVTMLSTTTDAPHIKLWVRDINQPTIITIEVECVQPATSLYATLYYAA